MTARIGKFNIIHSQLLLIPDGADAWVEFRAKNWDVKLKFLLVEDKENPNESTFDLTAEEDHGVITLKNWSHSLGMSFKEPVDFGSTDGEKVYFMAFGHKVGNVTKLELQFYMECQNER